MAVATEQRRIHVIAVRERPRWTRAAALGLALCGSGPLLMLVSALAWGLSVAEELPFFIPAAAVPLIAAALVLRFGTWARILGALAGLLVPFMMFWTAFSLGSPGSFFDFMPGVLVVPGGLLGTVSCIASIVAGRRGHRTATAERGERRMVFAAAAVVALALVASGVATTVSRSSDTGAADVTVRMSDFEFSQDAYTVPIGGRVLVRNDDPYLHTFTIKGGTTDITLTPGSRKIVTIDEPPGEYVFYCRPHSDNESPDPDGDDMAARLSVS